MDKHESLEEAVNCAKTLSMALDILLASMEEHNKAMETCIDTMNRIVKDNK